MYLRILRNIKLKFHRLFPDQTYPPPPARATLMHPRRAKSAQCLSEECPFGGCASFQPHDRSNAAKIIEKFNSLINIFLKIQLAMASEIACQFR